MAVNNCPVIIASFFKDDDRNANTLPVTKDLTLTEIIMEKKTQPEPIQRLDQCIGVYGKLIQFSCPFNRRVNILQISSLEGVTLVVKGEHIIQ